MDTDSSCQDILKILPSVVIGGVENAQLKEVLEHVGRCERCFSTLEEECWLLQMASAHIPSWELALFAQGVPSESLPREVVVDHLAICPSCREEVSFAMLDRLPDIQAKRQERFRDRAGRIWKVVSAAAAACLIFVALSFLWIRQTTQLEPQVVVGNPPISEIGPAIPETSSDNQQQPAAAPLFASGFESGEPAGWSQ